MSAKKHKYSARPTIVDGIKFASAKEARRYGELKLLQMAGKISQLELQPRYKLVIEETYVADFRYLENGKTVIEDVKGFLTADYKRKRKAMKIQHGVTILET
jgi:predicted nuclease of restriction endonuclease-like RecB superfamily